MIAIRTEEEIAVLREANQIVADVLQHLIEIVRPGVSTRQLDEAAETLIRMRGAEPAFKGYHGYPASTCISIDEGGGARHPR